MNAMKLMWLAVMAGMPMLLVAGCTQYHTPGGPADLKALGLGPEQAGIADRMRMPVSALVAVVRVQAPEYRSMTRNGTGGGAVTAVLEADSEDGTDLARLGKMYAVRGTVGINRIVLPATVGNISDLMGAARAAGADAMFIYTLDTKFFDPENVAYGQQLKLGFGNAGAHVDSMASGAFVDLTSGQIFGQAQATASFRINGDDFSSAQVIDKARRNAERAAFRELTREAEARWQVAQERAVH